jgi:hypothetical protein
MSRTLVSKHLERLNSRGKTAAGLFKTPNPDSESNFMQDTRIAGSLPGASYNIATDDEQDKKLPLATSVNGIKILPVFDDEDSFEEPRRPLPVDAEKAIENALSRIGRNKYWN